jgi:RNA polymerase sigma-70 factor (ECF subfamily)
VTDSLVAAAQAGDTYALRAIYDDLAGPVCGYLRAKGVADPEGLTSDVFVTVLRRIATITGGADGLRRLVFTVAHARMVDAVRAEVRAPDFVEYDAESDVRTAPSAEDEAQARLGTERVLAVLAALPDDQREVLALRVVSDLPLEQVAEIMHRSVGAVKQLQRRALISARRHVSTGRVTLDSPRAMT